ncbi:MAG: hypothetical protein LBL63_02150, partial [Clostridiales Family XIII bacterium]|nr:hypothetical protein [Clostridiales Family XIII bacterium]
MDTQSRIALMKKNVFKQMDTRKEWMEGELTILDDPTIEKLPLVVRRAMAINLLLEKLPTEIRDHELVVGVTAMGSVALGAIIPEYATAKEKAAGAAAGFTELSTFGHHPINFDKFLKWGLSGYRTRIVEKLEEELEKPESDRRPDAVNLYRAMLINLDGIRNFAHRYAKLALEKALAEQDGTRRKELLEIHGMLQRIPEQPPQTYYEALQSQWLLFCVMHSSHERIPVGNVDQYLYPFYSRDIETGILDTDRAEELTAAWLIKFSDNVQINRSDILSTESRSNFGAYSFGIAPITENPDDMMQSFLDNGVGCMISCYFGEGNDRYKGMVFNSNMQNAILGGLDKEGNDATNDLTYGILDIWNRLELIRPVMNVRFSKKTPEALYEKCASIVRCGNGEPAMYNDELIVNGLTNIGIPIEEARRYSNDGCWEAVIPGKTSFTIEMFNVLQMVDFVLFRGKSILRNQSEGFDTGDPLSFKDFEMFYAAYLSQVKQSIELVLRKRRENYPKVNLIAPDSLISIFIEHCIETGKELNDGGAAYRLNTPCLAGFANAIDSLAAIKRLVFEEKSVDMDALIDALKSNFEGKEALRQKLVNRAPKFGNDDDFADEIAVRFMEDLARFIDGINSAYPEIHNAPIIGTFERAGDIGMTTDATPDGRPAGEPVSNNYSPMNGVDLNGPTATVRSFTKPDLLPYYCGCPLDMHINPNEAIGEAGIKK